VKKLYIILAVVILLALLPTLAFGKTALTGGADDTFIISVEEMVIIDDEAVPMAGSPLRGDVAILLIAIIAIAIVGALVTCVRGKRAEREEHEKRSAKRGRRTY